MNDSLLSNRVRSVHIVGISGVVTSQLAALLKKQGKRVTGSDRAIYPPASTFLKASGIDIWLGFKKEHVAQHPDLIIASSFVTEANPEIRAARAQKITIVGFAEVVPELVERPNSVVVVGDHGKTTISGLAAWLLETWGKNPNFLIGGFPRNFETGLRTTNSDWSVMEGDEYPILSWKPEPKFSQYHPKYLIVPDIRWDHMGAYPTVESYETVFRRLFERIPADGAIIACKTGQERLLPLFTNAKAEVRWYGETDSDGIELPRTGRIWRENSGAAVGLGKVLRIPQAVITEALRTFQGIKRRQEIRYHAHNFYVIDDFAHSPVKVLGSISSLREEYAGTRLVVVYEPGDRSEKSLQNEEYRSCFMGADRIILPRITTSDAAKKSFSERLVKFINTERRPVEYVDEDAEVIELLLREARQNEPLIIVFMSQRGFRGMIEELISKLKQTKL